MNKIDWNKPIQHVSGAQAVLLPWMAGKDKVVAAKGWACWAVDDYGKSCINNLPFIQNIPEVVEWWSLMCKSSSPIGAPYYTNSYSTKEKVIEAHGEFNKAAHLVHWTLLGDKLSCEIEKLP